MKLFVRLLIPVFCLAFSVYAPEAQDRPAGEPQEVDQNLTTVAAMQEALAAHLESAREARKANEFLNAVRFLNRAGHLQLRLSLPQEALGRFQESLKLTEQLNEPAAKVDALNGVAAALLHISKYPDAIPLLEEAGRISEQHNYPQGRAEALLLLSEAQNHTQHVLALKTAHDALAQWQATGNNRGIIRSYLTIGTYQLSQTSLDESTRSNETARNLSREAGLKDLEAEALIMLGFIEYRKGAWHNMTKFLWDAEKLVDPEADPFKMTQITSSIAEAYIESGLPELGLPKYQEALDYIRKAQRPRDEIQIRCSIGRNQYLAENYPEALVILQAGLADAASLKLPVVMATCQEILGRTYNAMNDRALALSNLESARQLFSKTENPMETARVGALIGQIYEMSGQFDQARKSYQAAMRTFDALSDRVNQSATLFVLGRLEMKAGNNEAAEAHLRQSVEATENMRRMSTSRDLTAAFSATVHDRYEQYIQCLMRNDRGSSTSSRAVLAFETSELARARSLAELLRVSDTNLLSNIDAEVSKRERALRQLLRVKEDEKVHLLATKYEKPQLEKLDVEVEKLDTEYKNLVATINARYPAYAQITQPQSWDLARIQKEVISDDDTVLLEYLLGSEKSHVWAVTRNGITSRELPSESVITKAVQTLYDLVKEPAKPETKDQLDQATRKLGEMVLGPIADQLNKRQIIVAADGALHYIPFQMLPASSTSLGPLVAGHQVINTPSASVLGELRKEAASRGVRAKALAIFGNPMFPAQNEQVKDSSRSIELKSGTFDLSTIGRLFYSAREVANLRDVASEPQTFAATDYDATRDQLLRTDLTQYAILHFATHGFLDPKRPENSGLLLSTVDREGKALNGFVGLQDVYSLRAPVDLVVLSACETGLGKDIRGEGLVGLTRGFMYAGGTSVVASLWKVQDEATAELMKSFYTEMLKNGKTPAEALRSAQNSIRQIPKWSAPHYWAGFTLQGEYRYVVNSSRGWQVYQVALLVALGVLLLGTSKYLYRRFYG
jgi:CHAT domain-containing protein